MIRKLKYLVFVGASLIAAAVTTFADSPASRFEGLAIDMEEYEHINSIVVTDTESPVHGFHHFYMSDKGLDTFKSAKDEADYSNGTVIVGKVYQPRKTEDGAYQEGDLLAYTLMRKEPGNPATKDTGGWRFAKFDAQKAPVEIDPITDCFHCHKPHAATDYVISEPLD